MKDETECKGFLGVESSNAVFVHESETGSFGHWIPRGQIRRMTKTLVKGKRTEIVFILPEWLVEKNYLHNLVNK